MLSMDRGKDVPFQAVSIHAVVNQAVPELAVPFRCIPRHAVLWHASMLCGARPRRAVSRRSILSQILESRAYNERTSYNIAGSIPVDAPVLLSEKGLTLRKYIPYTERVLSSIYIYIYVLYTSVSSLYSCT